MKRFLLFAGDNYYPSGGWAEFCGSFATMDEAIAEGKQKLADNNDWAHVVDTQQPEPKEVDVRITNEELLEIIVGRKGGAS